MVELTIKNELEELQQSSSISDFEQERMVEAILFASTEPITFKELKDRLPTDLDLQDIIDRLQEKYSDRGFTLIKVSGGYAFRTASDLSFLLQKHVVEHRKLSKAALEVLAIVAYHQSSTRAEIEEIRGVSVSSGTLDLLMHIGWIGLGPRRKSPGRPLTFKTTESFLNHFGLESTRDLPGIKELRETGLLEPRAPTVKSTGSVDS